MSLFRKGISSLLKFSEINDAFITLVTSAGWQVTLCDPIRHVSSRSREAIVSNCYRPTPFTLTFALDLHSGGPKESCIR